MGLIVGFFKLIIRLILFVSVFIAFILLIPNLPPYTKFTSIKIEPTQQRSGSLAPNDVLNKAKHLYKDKLLGPECFQVWNDEVYTSLATGEIVKLSRGGHVTFVTKIGQPCTGLTQDHICGRPLGFVIDETNKDILVSDAYLGIWKVNIKTDKKQLLVSPRVAIDGKIPMLFNSIALGNNGDIYWTHSSSEFHLSDGVFAVLSDPSGRLLYYNAAKNESKVLLDDLWFPNGLAVSPDDQFIVVAETNKYRLIKYYINEPKKGKSEVFITGLPGMPDNVRPLPDGSGVLVALYGVFDDDNPLIVKSMAEAPLARKFVSRLFRLIEIPFEFLQTHFNNHVFESIVHYIGSFPSTIPLASGMSGLVQIDWNGDIVASYYNTDGSVIHISDAIVFNDQLYTACPHIQDYVGAVPAPPLLKKAFTKTSKQQPKIEIKKEQIKPTANEPKEVPKTAKPVQKSQPPKADKPIDIKQETKPASQTKPPPPAKQAEVKKSITEESKPKITAKQDSKPDVKPKVLPKDDTKPKTKENAEKPKSEPKRKESQPKIATKEETNKQKAPVEKPKVEPKGTESKPKVATKEETNKQKAPAEKPKVEPKGTESKPKVATKEETPKQKVSAEKPKDVKKEPEVKHQQAQKVDKKQPVIKETSQADKTKPTVKQTIDKETVSKSDKKSEKAQAKPVQGSEPAKAAPKTAEAKASESKTQPKPKKVKEEPRKAIPIEEEIPSDTKKPSEGKLKVIKKSGPQEIPNPHL